MIAVFKKDGSIELQLLHNSGGFPILVVKHPSIEAMTKSLERLEMITEVYNHLRYILPDGLEIVDERGFTKD